MNDIDKMTIATACLVFGMIFSMISISINCESPKCTEFRSILIPISVGSLILGIVILILTSRYPQLNSTNNP